MVAAFYLDFWPRTIYSVLRAESLPDSAAFYFGFSAALVAAPSGIVPAPCGLVCPDRVKCYGLRRLGTKCYLILVVSILTSVQLSMNFRLQDTNPMQQDLRTLFVLWWAFKICLSRPTPLRGLHLCLILLSLASIFSLLIVSAEDLSVLLEKLLDLLRLQGPHMTSQ